jgi:hypothetical protein
VLGTVFASRAEGYLGDHGTPQATRAARGLSGGQAQQILQKVPESQRPRVDSLLHGAAAAGLDGAMIGAGLVGVIAGLLALVLIRPAKVAEPAASTSNDPVPA